MYFGLAASRQPYTLADCSHFHISCVTALFLLPLGSFGQLYGCGHLVAAEYMFSYGTIKKVSFGQLHCCGHLVAAEYMFSYKRS